jgi:hypothetical protein
VNLPLDMALSSRPRQSLNCMGTRIANCGKKYALNCSLHGKF